MDTSIPQNINPPQKRCSKCEQYKPATPDFFPYDRKRKDGFNLYCKKCNNEYNRSRYTRKTPLPEVLPDGHKRCTQCKEMKPATPEYFHRSGSKLIARCKACAAASGHAYHLANLEARKAYGRAYYSSHTEEKRIYGQRHYREHYSYYMERNRRYIAESKEKRRIYNKTHRGQKNAWERKRRALKRGSQGSFTPQDIKQQYQRQKGKCYYCRVKVGQGYHIEHIVPVSRGGSNDISNIVIACPACNMKKQGRLPHEWIEGGRLL